MLRRGTKDDQISSAVPHPKINLYTARTLSDFVTQNCPSHIALMYVTIKYPSGNLVSVDSVDRNWNFQTSAFET
jgi:hypothetical protein